MNRSVKIPAVIVSIGVAAAVLCGGPTLACAQEHHEGHRRSVKHSHHEGGSVGRWLPRLEGADRDGWQRPDYVTELLGISPGMTVADLGTGTGYFVPHLAAAVGERGHVLALDIDDELVEYVVERARTEGLVNVDARVIAPDDPRLETGTVDRVLIVNTWHHIHDREAYAARLARALTGSGAVYVVDFTVDSPHGPPRDHRLTPERVAAELSAAGLTITVLDEELPWQYVVVGRLVAVD